VIVRPPAMVNRGKEALVAQDPRRPAVTLSVVEDVVAAEELITISLIDLGQVLPQEPSVDRSPQAEEST
jgi:hypothetical protein